MTSSPTAPPPANWYLDPQDANSLRWWDGAQWTDHRAPLPVPVVPPKPDKTSRNALTFGLLSWIINPVMVTSVAAVVLGIIGVRRSRITGLGRAGSVWGIVLGSITFVIYCFVFGNYINNNFGDPTEKYDGPGMERSILKWSQAYDPPYASVDCPATGSMAVGNEFQCTGNLVGGGTDTVYVKVIDTAGYVSWEVR